MLEGSEELTLEDGSHCQLYRAQTWPFGGKSLIVDRLVISSSPGQEIDCIIFEEQGKAAVKLVRKEIGFSGLDISGLVNTEFFYRLPPTGATIIALPMNSTVVFSETKF